MTNYIHNIKSVNYTENVYKNNQTLNSVDLNYVPYENNKYIRSIMVKYRHPDVVKPALEKLLKSALNKSGISISINIDPYNL